MYKNVISEQAIYHGNVDMPDGWEIDSLELSKSAIDSFYTQKNFIFSKSWDRLNTFFIENFKLRHDFSLVNKDSWFNVYIPNEITEPLNSVNPVDLKNSPDFTLLYGINTIDCEVRIFYDDNRRKGCSWDIQLENNKFIMFPSTNTYYIKNSQKNSLNFVQTITYEYI